VNQADGVIPAIGHIANRRHDEGLANVLDRAQADLDRKLRAVAPLSAEIKPQAHRAHAHVAEEVHPVSDVLGPKTLRHQRFDALADDFVVRIPEQS
jgi:hypothetical protein